MIIQIVILIILMIINLLIAIRDANNSKPNIINAFAAGFTCFCIISLLLK